ncbi:MAG: hypothetical protein ACI8RD_011728 [Bacillariaceae sp.]|jgi:hypothetical protein
MLPIKLLGDDIPVVNALLANACCTYEEQLRDIDSMDSDHQYQCLSYSSCEPPLGNNSSFTFSMLLVGSRVVSIGAIFGLTTATFACLMGQPRIFFSMAQDGLLFKIYGRINPKTGVPTAGTVLTGIMTAFVACFIDLESLANTISLGTLQVFSFVNAGVIVLRMTPPLASIATEMEDNIDGGRGVNDKSYEKVKAEPNIFNEQSGLLISSGERRSSRYSATDAASTRRHSHMLPDDGGFLLVKRAYREFRSSSSSTVVNGDACIAKSGSHIRLLEQNGSKPYWLTLVITLLAVLSSMGFSRRWPIWILITTSGFLFVSIIALSRLPQGYPPDTFSCPWVPAVPLMGILCNSYMMGSMPLSTWSAIFAWLLVGVCFYFSYGIHNSALRKTTIKS